MLPWETAGEARSDPNEREFARIWTALPKVVFSTTLETVEGNARLATGGVAEEVAALKAQQGTCPLAAPASPPPWSSWT